MCLLRDVTCTDPTARRRIDIGASEGGGPLRVQGLGGWATAFRAYLFPLSASLPVMPWPPPAVATVLTLSLFFPRS